MLSESRRDLIGLAFAVLVLGLAAFVLQRFLLPLLWAALLAIASWPLYLRLRARMGNRAIPSALLLTFLMAIVLLVPLGLGLRQAVLEAPPLAAAIAQGNEAGIPAPAALLHLPLVGPWIGGWWQATLAQPHGLAHLAGAQGRLHSATGMLRDLGGQVFRRLIDLGFAFLCLFFFYKDGDALHRQMVLAGTRAFGVRRWWRYVHAVPGAVRGTVNGLVLVGLAEGLLIGIGYAVAGLPSPGLWGTATALLAIIPFGAPVVYLAAALLLLGTGHDGAAMGIALWGTVVLFVADHFVRPAVIGNATRLPFIAVLFGILGGVEGFGLVGLFVGPVVMVLFVTLWRELSAPVGPPERHHDAAQ